VLLLDLQLVFLFCVRSFGLSPLRSTTTAAAGRYEILICYTGEGITPPGQTYDLPAQGSVEQASYYSNEISLQAKDK